MTYVGHLSLFEVNNYFLKKKQPIELLKVIHQGDKGLAKVPGVVPVCPRRPFALLPVFLCILRSFFHIPGGTENTGLRYISVSS